MQSKILIISNAALNQTDSNGRTLLRLLDCFESKEKAQFYTYGNPDLNECSCFYHVSDMDALKSLALFSKKNGFVDKVKGLSGYNLQVRKKRKTPFKMLVRELIWKFGRWNNKFLKEWVNKFNPNCILVAAGDNCFTLDLARNISKKREIPIILYSTEEYPFKDYNYVTRRFSFFYKIWRRKLLKSYKKIESHVVEGIFNSEALAKLYSSKYSYRCSCIYQSSNIDFIENDNVRDEQVISYLGNLGLNRHKALIEIADALQFVSPGVKLNVYGKPSGDVKEELENNQNINLCGFIPYDKVIEVIHSSTLLVHAEYDDEFYNRDLKYAFSTKITDSVCSGTPFFIYAPKQLEETNFLKENDCAFVVQDKVDLVVFLRTALFDLSKRSEIVKNAKKVREKYFLSKGMLRKIVEEVINEGRTG